MLPVQGIYMPLDIRRYRRYAVVFPFSSVKGRRRRYIFITLGVVEFAQAIIQFQGISGRRRGAAGIYSNSYSPARTAVISGGSYGSSSITEVSGQVVAVVQRYQIAAGIFAIQGLVHRKGQAVGVAAGLDKEVRRTVDLFYLNGQ